MSKLRLLHIGLEAGMQCNLVPLALLAAILAGCGIPPSMHVREGGEPRYQDEDVLFQTTYYFRVFDFCDDGSNQGNARRIKSDSLYRFRMTGKGKSSFSKVRFESGTLQAWQIDPLGASVEFDKNTGKPYFVSPQKREEGLRQSRLYDEVGRLRGLLTKLNCEPRPEKAATAADDQKQCEIVRSKIEDNLRLIGPGGIANAVGSASALAQEAILTLAGSLRDDPAQVKANAANPPTAAQLRARLEAARESIRLAPDKLALLVALDKAEAEMNSMTTPPSLKAFVVTPPGRQETDAADKDLIDAGVKIIQQAKSTLLGSQETHSNTASLLEKSLACGTGLPARRGFQILGPEGWRTFDQDERLVLAMSASGRPLLDALRDLSNRVLSEKSAGFSHGQLLAQSLAASRARIALGQVENASANTLSDALTALVAAFEQKGD